MARFLFIRHGAHDLLGRVLVGRRPGVHINSEGVHQAQWLAQRIARVPIDCLISSPLERAQETAAIIARALKREVQIDPAFNEIDFGEWTDSAFSHLESVWIWKQFNCCRSWSSPPAGESLLAALERVVRRMKELQREFPEGVIAVVSHADVIKVVVMYCMGMPIDFVGRLEISPGSLSIMKLGESVPMIELINERMEGA